MRAKKDMCHHTAARVNTPKNKIVMPRMHMRCKASSIFMGMPILDPCRARVQELRFSGTRLSQRNLLPHTRVGPVFDEPNR
jgi:hypothetical protein